MLTKLIAFLFAMAVIAIPFDAIPGVKAFGELAHESSFYLFAIAIGLYNLKVAGAILAGDFDAQVGGRFIWLTGTAIVVVIAISAIWNAIDISTATFHNRDGFPKLINSATVIVYGLTLALLTRAIVPGRWYTCLALPICVSASLCVGFGILEAFDRAGVSLPLYHALNSMLHAGSDLAVQSWDGSTNLKLIEVWDKRLRTVSFEPPAFGNFSGLAWPWLLAAIFMTKGVRRAVHICLLIAFTVLIVAAQARTGWLLLATDIAVFGLARFVFLPPHGRVRRSAALIINSGVVFASIALVIVYVARFDEIVRSTVSGSSVSDISRLAYQVTAGRMFAMNPISGAGLGQFAFKASSYMPEWGYFSPEIKASLQYPEAPWPNTYSLYARLAAELGVVGLVGWIAIWVTLMVSVRRAGLVYSHLGRTVPEVAYPIIMNCAGVLVAAVTTDTFRTPMIWITLGVGACLSARAQQLAGGLVQARPFSDPTVRDDRRYIIGVALAHRLRGAFWCG
ncbi:O-antigen ligase family protein [Bradyrhizobium monzae]|uniref:O-antigen ligase family protein n=1 Tax=Bradyrhizobium sp. Oc8 TaxID=2876780 RepID=UPI001F32FA92|nr:O-antigen ligase family protein [Bradyrhizobium sp. Oc8]